MKKPAEPTRTTIRPSDLTFGLSTCHRCLWLFYWFKLDLPKIMPLVSPLSAMQEKAFRNANLRDIDPGLPKGKITKFGQKVTSKKFMINGEKTRWCLAGKYDLLSENEDGTASLIDCKVSKNDQDQSALYGPQLEAYVFALEFPEVGQPEKVATIGLLKWNPDRVLGNDPATYAFGVTQEYEAVERNVDGFYKLMKDCIEMLEGPMPTSGEKCNTCKYLNDREKIGL
jgi:hypothetical protein